MVDLCANLIAAICMTCLHSVHDFIVCVWGGHSISGFVWHLVNSKLVESFYSVNSLLCIYSQNNQI